MLILRALSKLLNLLSKHFLSTLRDTLRVKTVLISVFILIWLHLLEHRNNDKILTIIKED